MISYLAGYIAASADRQGGEYILEGGPWEDRRAKLFPTREQAAAAGRKQSYEYTRPYEYQTDNPRNARGMQQMDAVEDTGKVAI